MGRAPCCDKDNVKKGPWSPEEDAKLKEYIEKNGTGGNWIALPHKIGLKRCGKSCRLRWLNYLRPNVKRGGFSEEEDNIICSLYLSSGSRWSIIAAQLPGRTDNEIKNYWNTRLKKKLLATRKEPQIRNIPSSDEEANWVNLVNNNNPTSPALTSSALERVQLHMQLQNLQNPLSFYNQPTPWPKNHTLEEDIFQNQYNLVQSILIQQDQISPIQPVHKSTIILDNLSTHSNACSIEYLMDLDQQNEELENSLNGFASSSSAFAFDGSLEKSSMNYHVDSGLQNELCGQLNNKMSVGFKGLEDQISENYHLRDVIGAKENTVCWASEFCSKSLPDSWNSSSIFQAQDMFL